MRRRGYLPQYGAVFLAGCVAGSRMSPPARAEVAGSKRSPVLAEVAGDPHVAALNIRQPRAYVCTISMTLAQLPLNVCLSFVDVRMTPLQRQFFKEHFFVACRETIFYEG